MSKKNKIVARAVGTAVVLSLMTGAAYAGGFALREQSAYFQGTSFAGNGTSGPSISSMFWNPASITGHEGLKFEGISTFIVPRAEIKPTTAAFGTTPSGDMAADAWVPTSYMTYQLNDDVYLGLGINAPYGLTTKPDPAWAGRYHARTSRIFSINANPVIAYQVNDMFSVAAGLQVQYFKLSLKNALPVTGTGADPSRELKGDSVGVGFTAGVTMKPMEGTEIGLGFRSSINHSLDGDIVMPFAFPPLAAGNNAITASLNTPEMVTLSAKQKLTDKLRLLGTVEWSNWSRLKAPGIVLDSVGVPIASLHLNYEDGWFFALGGEYDYNEKLTFRTGLAYEISPIRDSTRGLRLPDNDRIWASAGLTYTHNEHLSFDLGYSHIFGTDTPINIVPGHQDYTTATDTFVGSADSQVDILSASLRYKF